MPFHLHGPHNGWKNARNRNDGWGQVPESDRPLWSRYMLDHCPTFPGPSILTFIARGVVNGGTRIPPEWKNTAAELHNAGFSPMQYFLLAELLSEARKKDRLNKSEHEHLFKEWFKQWGSAPSPGMHIDAEAWKPWLQRVKQGQSPRRALEHVLQGPDLQPLGSVTSFCGGPSFIVSD